MQIPRIVIAAPASGQGKTTLSMGIMASLKRRGLSVQPYKVGPDYIDPAFHTAITGRNSVNLDSWLVDETYLKSMFRHYSADAGISVIEGVMGLYDGFGSNPLEGSTAGMSKLLGAPVVLVIQVDGMAGTAAALVCGMKYLADCDVKAVIINKPSSEFHYELVKDAIENNTGTKVIGYLPEKEDIELKSRHLGLVQQCETGDLNKRIERLADLVDEYIDMQAVMDIANEAEDFTAEPLPFEETNRETVRIAVALDEAFNFYYHENLELLKRQGAELIYFSPIRDSSLPENTDGIYLGGGYPEVFARELYENQNMRKAIKDAADRGMPIFAECGGYMYLNAELEDMDGVSQPGVGIFPGNAVMTDRLQNFGYLEMSATKENYLMKGIPSIRAHEFHKTKIILDNPDYCIKASKKAAGKIKAWECGLRYKNVFALYPHVYFPANVKFAINFLEQCRKPDPLNRKEMNRL